MSEMENLEALLEDSHGLKTLSASSSTFLNNVTDPDLIDLVQEIEHSATHHLYDNVGLLQKKAVDTLKKHGIEVIRLTSEQWPFEHAVKCKDMHILVSP